MHVLEEPGVETEAKKNEGEAQRRDTETGREQTELETSEIESMRSENESLKRENESLRKENQLLREQLEKQPIPVPKPVSNEVCIVLPSLCLGFGKKQVCRVHMLHRLWVSQLIGNTASNYSGLWPNVWRQERTERQDETQVHLE